MSQSFRDGLYAVRSRRPVLRNSTRRDLVGEDLDPDLIIKIPDVRFVGVDVPCDVSHGAILVHAAAGVEAGVVADTESRRERAQVSLQKRLQAV